MKFLLELNCTVLTMTSTSKTKTVLVSYLEKNKRMIISPEESESELDYLRREFLVLFKFEANVKLDVTFQKFDSDWNEFVDSEDTDEICDKDKLKAVVTPILTQETPEGSTCTSRNEVSVSLF